MRCREVDALWDECRGEEHPPAKVAVERHLAACPPCQDLYREYEGVVYRLSALPRPEPSCDLARRIIEHIAALRATELRPSVTLCIIQTPLGRTFVGYRAERIVFLGIDIGKSHDAVREQVAHRLRRDVAFGDTPAWLAATLEGFFRSWHLDDSRIDLSGLTPFERAALTAAASIPPGETRSYGWIASQIGKPKAARAVGQAMARNPIALLLPCHRVVDASGALHNYGYGLAIKAKLLALEGYRTPS